MYWRVLDRAPANVLRSRREHQLQKLAYDIRPRIMRSDSDRQNVVIAGLSQQRFPTLDARLSHENSRAEAWIRVAAGAPGRKVRWIHESESGK
jgi:hypothetical protein